MLINKLQLNDVGCLMAVFLPFELAAWFFASVNWYPSERRYYLELGGCWTASSESATSNFLMKTTVMGKSSEDTDLKKSPTVRLL